MISELKVLQSAAGFYLGRTQDGMPYSRESVQYWPSRIAAADALKLNSFTRRPNP